VVVDSIALSRLERLSKVDTALPPLHQSLHRCWRAPSDAVPVRCILALLATAKHPSRFRRRPFQALMTDDRGKAGLGYLLKPLLQAFVDARLNIIGTYSHHYDPEPSPSLGRTELSPVPFRYSVLCLLISRAHTHGACGGSVNLPSSRASCMRWNHHPSINSPRPDTHSCAPSEQLGTLRRQAPRIVSNSRLNVGPGAIGTC